MHKCHLSNWLWTTEAGQLYLLAVEGYIGQDKDAIGTDNHFLSCHDTKLLVVHLTSLSQGFALCNLTFTDVFLSGVQTERVQTFTKWCTKPCYVPLACNVCL